ncbi:hypothetical protein FOA52_012152 [Chlamydomonas sp. UWO 241]|nr:hypothetical protein FOA52_012152 [Chlamydomonas sp. UWO 241]
MLFKPLHLLSPQSKPQDQLAAEVSVSSQLRLLLAKKTASSKPNPDQASFCWAMASPPAPPAWGGGHGTRVGGSAEQSGGTASGAGIALAPGTPLPSGTSQSIQAVADAGGGDSQTNVRRPAVAASSSGRNSPRLAVSTVGDPVPSGLPDAAQALHKPGPNSLALGAAAVTGGLAQSAAEPPAAVKKPLPVKAVATASVARLSLGVAPAAASSALASFAPLLSTQSSASSISGDEDGMVYGCSIRYMRRPAHDASALSRAVAEEDTAEIASLLKSGACAGGQGDFDRRKNSSIHFAAANGNTAILDQLLTHASGAYAMADLCNQANIDDCTPLHCALHFGHASTARLLIERGADPLHRNEIGETALHVACKEGHVELARTLLGLPRCEPSALTMGGRTALHFAAARGAARVVAPLLQAGCDPALVDQYGTTPIQLCQTNTPTTGGPKRSGQRGTPESGAGSGSPAEYAESLRLLQSSPAGGSGASRAAGVTGSTPLHHAATAGQLEVVQKLLDAADVRIDAMDSNSLTPLLAAMHAGHKVIQDLLLKAGARTDFKLHWAACNGHSDLVTETLSAGVAVDLLDADGWSALHKASTNGYAAAADALLRCGADVHRLVRRERTPIGLAARGGHAACVATLLQYGANVNSLDAHQVTPLSAASSAGSADTVTVILEAGGDHTRPDRNGDTPLHLTARLGHGAVARVLLRAPGIKVDVVNTRCETPLVLAHAGRRGEHSEASSLLKAAGADIGFRLHSAAFIGNEVLVRELLVSGVSPELVDAGGMSALHAAAMGGQVASAELIVDHWRREVREHAVHRSMLSGGGDSDPSGAADGGGDGSHGARRIARESEAGVSEVAGPSQAVNFIDLPTKTVKLGMQTTNAPALWVAAACGHRSLVRVLLKAGADLMVVNYQHRSVLHVAAGAGHIGIVSDVLKYAKSQPSKLATLLGMKNKVSGMSALLVASQYGFTEIVMLLLEAGADLHACDLATGSTPLHAAAGNGHLSVVKAAVSHGAPLNDLNAEGYAPMHLATEGGHTSVVKYLLLVGAQHSLPSIKGHTPLMLAARNGHIALLKMLYEAGSDLRHKDIAGATALHHACGKMNVDNVETVTLLIQMLRSSNPDGGDLNMTDAENQTPLFEACDSDDTKTALALLAAGALVKVYTNTSSSPLLVACSKGNLEIVTALFAANDPAEISRTDKNKIGTLAVAAMNGHCAMVELLLSMHPPDVDGTPYIDTPDYKGDTPLMLAVASSHPRVVKLLMEHGAKVTHHNRAGLAAIHIAASVNNVECMRLLHEGSGSLATFMGRMPIHIAAAYGATEVVKRLLDDGGDVNQCCVQAPIAPIISEWTSFDPEATVVNGMELETRLGSAARVSASVTSSAIDEMDMRDEPQASKLEDDMTVALFPLLNNNGLVYYEVTIVDAPASEPCRVTIGVAAKQAALAFKLGTLPGTCGYEGATGHTYAGLLSSRQVYSKKFGKGDVIGVAWNRAYHTISFTKNGRHLGVAFRNFQPPSEGGLWAAVGVESQAVKLSANFVGSQREWVANLDELLYMEELQSNTGDVPPWDHKSLMYPMHFVTCCKNSALLAMLLARGATVDQLDVDGWTPLHKAAFAGWTEGLRMLIAEDADVNCSTAFGSFPLLFTVLNSHTEATRMLLDHGADVTVRNYQGRTLLMLAASVGNVTVMELLLKRNAQVNAKDKSGKTAMQYASNSKAVDCLVKALQGTVTYREVFEINMQAEVKRGGSGTVMMARHVKLGLQVAIKFHKERGMRDHSASVLRDLSSSYCATVPSNDHDVFLFDDRDKFPDCPFAMVTYGGEQSLFDFLSEHGHRALAENQIRYIFECITAALLHLHGKGYVHHDLKTNNLVRFYDGKYRLIDFDSTRKTGDRDVGNTTIDVCSPEVASFMLGTKPGLTSDPSMDIWALGTILYQLLTQSDLISDLFGTAWSEKVPEDNLVHWQALSQERINQRIESVIAVNTNKTALQGCELLSKMLQINPKKRYNIASVASHAFLKGGGNNVTMDAKAFAGVRNEIKTMHGKVDTILCKTIEIEKRTIALSDLPKHMREGFQNIGLEFQRVREVVVQVAKFSCPSSFVIVPDVTPADMMGPGKTKSVQALGTWVSALQYAYSQPRPFKSLVEKFTKQVFRLHLKCECCFEPQAPGYTIEMASTAAVKLLPAMQIGFAVVNIYNVAAGIGRLFFPFVPAIPADMLDEVKGIMDCIQSKSTAADFAVVEMELDKAGASRQNSASLLLRAKSSRSVVIDDGHSADSEHSDEDESSEDGEGDDRDDAPFTPDETTPTGQVGASLRELKAFLRTVDTANTWGGLTMIELEKPTSKAQEQRVLWVCPACLSGQSACASASAPVPVQPPAASKQSTSSAKADDKALVVARRRTPPVGVAADKVAPAEWQPPRGKGGGLMGCFSGATVLPEG